jgi:hypothetical protein
MEPIDLRAGDFLDELRIAPKWNIFQYYQGGYFELLVFYSFGTWIYRSPSMQSMTQNESRTFYQDLMGITSSPTIASAKIR